jgi:predicted phage tail protein
MNLRYVTTRSTPPRWSLALLAALVVGSCLLGLGSSGADASLSDYPTLYLSGAASTVLPTSYKLVTSAGPGAPAAAPTVIGYDDAELDGLNCNSYDYVYTEVDSTGGETPASPPAIITYPADFDQWAEIQGLPTGVSVRLYRSCDNGVFERVADLPNNSSSSYIDTTDDAAAALEPALPQAQNVISLATTGYQDFSPGGSADPSTASPMDPGPYTSPNGKGWIVDGSGAVSFPTGTWTFKANVQQNAGSGTAHLVVGMWKVTVSGGAITGSTMLLDPTGAGENATNFITPTGAAAIVHTATVSGFSLASNQHLYVEFWRRQTGAMSFGGSANTIATMYVYDGTAQITHPAANAFPNIPILGSIAARVNTTPVLSANYTDPDADTGTLAFQLCADAACASVLQSGSSAVGIANGSNGTWTPTGLGDGTYYWRSQATDSAANISGWSATSSFVVDTVPPGLPTLGSPAAAARVNSTQLGATFVDSDSTDSGTVSFQLCSNASCTVVVSSSTSATVAGGTAVTWTPTGVADGTYYWRLRGTDAAGNQSAWTSPTQSFVLDTNPPGVPALTSPADTSYLGASPTLKGTFATADAGDSGKLDFQVCSDSGCTSVVASGSSATGLLNGATGSWTPGGLTDGGYYWRSRATDAAGNQSAWSAVRSFTLDTTAPTAPALGAVAARLKITPQLTGTFSDPAATDAGTLAFQLCSDAACTTVLQSNTQSAIANNASANWTPTSLSDGLYYFRVRATDAAGNQSSWAAGSFTVDTVAPAKPALVSPANAARVNTPQLNATFTDSDSTDSGTVTFQLCNDAACATVLNSSTTATVASGAGVSWAAGPLADGTYYWRASSLDAAGNQGAWSSVRSFVLDTVGPSVPTLVGLAAQVDASPSLSASFSDPDAGDTGTVSFQVCSDAACTTVVSAGSSAAGIANGANGSWTATGLAQGTYFWRARAQDAAGNQSAWSATQQFALDTTPPALPTVTGSPADGARLNQPPTLAGVYNDPSAGTGTLTFELCASSSCAAPSLLNSGTTGSLAAGVVGSWKPAFLFDGLYYWRVQSTDSAGNASAWSSVLSFTVDATPPNVPVLSSPVGMRVQSGPALAARVDDPTDPGDSARIYVQVCGDAACTGVLASGYSGMVPVGALATWTAPALGDGTYYWRAFGEDLVGNQSGWSATRTFVVDNTPPSVPTPGGDGDGVTVSKLRLSGTFSSSDPGDTGTLQFQLCTDPDCATVVLTGSSAGVAPGGTASWTPDSSLLDDGVYYWRVRSVDAAGNASAWTATRSLTLDDTPPGRPQDFNARIVGHVLTLTWRPPAGMPKVHGYALIVNGKKTRTLAPSKLKLRIRLRRNDRRSFAVAAIDPAGNMSEATRTIATFVPHVSLKQIRSASSLHHR